MITDDERHDIADGLRILAVCRHNTGVPDSEILDILEISCADIPNCSDAYDVERLADLIDRPSIKPEKVGPAYWRCPRCGKINYKFVILGDCGPLLSHNCAYCGAAIVDD